MPTTLQNVMIGEELLTAIRLLKTGLRELNRMDGATDFFHLPLLLLAAGFERMMKTVICCHHLATKGEFPGRGIFPQGKKGHNLVHLLGMITNDCFSDSYIARIPAAQADITFLRSDAQLKTIVRLLSDFGQGARYHNLNVVLGESDPGPFPDDEWQKLELAILQENPDWADRTADPTKSDAVFKDINARLTAHCERLARSLSRLFTIGGLGDLARQVSPHTHDFLFLMDDQLGERDYEAMNI